MIQLLPLLALFASAALPPENWVKVMEEDGMALLIDKDSIKPDGDSRSFRLKMTQPDGSVGVADVVVDCKTATFEPRHTELSKDGKVVSTRDYKPGEESSKADDAAGEAMLKAVCG